MFVQYRYLWSILYYWPGGGGRHHFDLRHENGDKFWKDKKKRASGIPSCKERSQSTWVPTVKLSRFKDWDKAFHRGPSHSLRRLVLKAIHQPTNMVGIKDLHVYTLVSEEDGPPHRISVHLNYSQSALADPSRCDRLTMYISQYISTPRVVERLFPCCNQLDAPLCLLLEL